MKAVPMAGPVLVVCALWGASLSAAEAQGGTLNWLGSMDEAQAAAKTAGKPILALFTGSDWCFWCVRLEDEVFSKPEFQAWAAENVVAVRFDFLRKTVQPTRVMRANEAALGQCGDAVQGFPTVVFLNEKGEMLGKSGYRPGGAAAWVQNAQRILASRKVVGQVTPRNPAGGSQTR